MTSEMNKKTDASQVWVIKICSSQMVGDYKTSCREKHVASRSHWSWNNKFAFWAFPAFHFLRSRLWKRIKVSSNRLEEINVDNSKPSLKIFLEIWTVSFVKESDSFNLRKVLMFLWKSATLYVYILKGYVLRLVRFPWRVNLLFYFCFRNRQSLKIAHQKMMNNFESTSFV